MSMCHWTGYGFDVIESWGYAIYSPYLVPLTAGCLSQMKVLNETAWTCNGQFQKISIPNHGRLLCFIPPLPSEIPKCVTPPCPQNSIIVNPPSPSEFPFFWKYIFNLATPIWTNEHDFMPPQGCDLAAPGDKLYSNLPLVARLCKLLFRSEFGYKNKHH